MNSVGSMEPPSPWIVQHAGLVPAGAPVLDVACGGGRHARWFLAAGHPVTAVDRAPRLDPAERLTIVEADLEDGRPFPFAPESFAGVIVTNYLFRPRLSAVVATVSPGGVLLYETFAIGHERYGRPRNPDFLLRPGELREVIAGELEVVAFEEIDDGAVRQRLAAVRPR